MCKTLNISRNIWHAEQSYDGDFVNFLIQLLVWSFIFNNKLQKLETRNPTDDLNAACVALKTTKKTYIWYKTMASTIQLQK